MNLQEFGKRYLVEEHYQGWMEQKPVWTGKEYILDDARNGSVETIGFNVYDNEEETYVMMDATYDHVANWMHYELTGGK